MTPPNESTALPNPLIPGFNPDPSCVLVDDTYYAVTSSFEYLPGLPVYRSTDFVTWEHIGNVITREAQAGLAETPSGAGVWAPTLRHHDGRFHVIVTITSSPRGCVVFTADDPTGPWSDGVSIDGVVGIDPDLAWDEDGTAYVTYSNLQMSDTEPWVHDRILQARADLATGKLLEEPRSLWSGTGLIAPEGPHLYHRDSHWYLVIAEGGTGHGHAVSVARGPSIEGPFEGAPGNPLLRVAGTSGPVQRTGHADLVRGPDGRDVLVLLGTRTAGGFTPLGRETFVTPVEWVDGWPQPAPVELNPRPESLDEHFDFADAGALADPGWLAVGRTPTEVATVGERSGHLTIRAVHGGLETFRPDFVGRRQRHLKSRFETRIDPSDGRGGLGLRYDERFTVALVAERVSPGGGTRVTARATMPSIDRSWSVEVGSGEVVLRIETDFPPPAGGTPWAGGGDSIRLVVVDDAGAETRLAELDGRFWSVEAAVPFTGRVTGIFAEEGVVRFADFRYHGDGGS
ncbi:family 43 glycosylhydrolase [Streptomyces sp. NPDC048277]|uniref:glycoside hydrolase family 43 protein n=1 Tax=Streptomyces sp. NPDC048277 TaxID=3155027 RepID=UPI003411A2EB